MTDPDQPAVPARGNTRGHRACTVLGAVSAPCRGWVDERGLVSPSLEQGAWTLDWWVGAEDRWHLPPHEASVRQHLVGETPVVETAMRVPGGDIVQRAYAVHGAVDEVVVEVENRSAVPVALALVVRSGDVDVAGAVRAVELAGSDLVVDGRVAVRLPSAPPGAVLCPGADALAAAVFPLPHTAVLRAALPMARAGPRDARPATLPSAERVSAGWAAQLGQGARVVLPSGPLAATVEANRAFLLLAHAGDHLVGVHGSDEEVAVLRALDEWGFHRQVAEVLGARADEPATAATLVALRRHWRLTRDAELVDHLSAALAAGVARLDRGGRRRSGEEAEADRWRVRGLRAASGVLAATGQPDAATAVAERATELASRLGVGGDTETVPAPDRSRGWWRPWDEVARARREVDAGDPAALARVSRLVSVAGPRRSWPQLAADAQGPDQQVAGDGHHLATGAAFLSVVRSLLVRELDDRDAPDRPRLGLCSVWPEEWMGQGLEVHGMPTAHGRLSYAVRWHGARPALLWELDAADTGGTPVTLLAPGLDTTWASRDPRGEALLAARTQSPGGPRRDEGASFS